MAQKYYQARNLTLNGSSWILKKYKLLWITAVLFFVLGCGLFAPTAAPDSDLFATLQASTPSGFSSPVVTEPGTTPVFNSFTPVATPTTNPSNPDSAATSVPSPSSSDQPTGHIVFTCQIFKVQAMNQICIMNADGTGYRRLTTEDNIQHVYPSLSPDGQSLLYAAFREQNVYEIYKLDLVDGSVDRLTNKIGVLTSPEFSPDGERITFTRGNPRTNQHQIMLMDANGDNDGNIPQINGWDPTWSPDGKRILFASDRDGLTQLFTMNLRGRQLFRVTNLPSIRGRSDWSPDGQFIVTYSGEPWNREVYIMGADGSNVRQLTPSGGNSQGPAFSPDGQWVAFTAYFDRPGDDHGCEIYIIRTDGTDLRRLTDNDYCDYQPRWGP
jgi:tol-pal system beta propeller repeat protein TolB